MSDGINIPNDLVVHGVRYNAPNAEELGNTKEDMLKALEHFLKKRAMHLSISDIDKALENRVTTLDETSSSKEFVKDTTDLLDALGKVIIKFVTDHEVVQNKKLTRYELKSSLDWIVKHFDLFD
jgi:hypothetical protein